ncbi:hypothetical protein B7486_75425, partial [cyanobacterium TDX16]
DRGLRAIDMTRNALGHVNIQISDDEGSSNAGAALEKAKLWVTRYAPLKSFDQWIERTATLLWFARTSVSGPLLPALNRGMTLVAWPPAPALAAELNPALLGRGFEIISEEGEIVSIEDVELLVAGEPTELDGMPSDDGLPLVLVRNDRETGLQESLWSGHQRLDGSFTGDALIVRHGYGAGSLVSEVF